MPDSDLSSATAALPPDPTLLNTESQPPRIENGKHSGNRGGVSPSPSSIKRSSTETSSTIVCTPSDPREPRWQCYLSACRWFIFDQWFLVALGCLILISSQVQVPASRQSKKELGVTYLCVAVIFLVTGCTLPTHVLWDNYGRWKIHLFVQVQSFLLTSVIVYAVVSICAMNPHFMDAGLLVGMIFAGCVPTTISSNVLMTGQAHGNQALAVVQSTLGNFLGPFMTPLLIEMYTASGAWYTGILPDKGSGGYGELYRRVFKQLGLSIFLPLVPYALHCGTTRRWANTRTRWLVNSYRTFSQK